MIALWEIGGGGGGGGGGGNILNKIYSPTLQVNLQWSPSMYKIFACLPA